MPCSEELRGRIDPALPPPAILLRCDRAEITNYRGGSVARKPNYGFQKRQRELAKAKKKEAKKLLKEEAAKRKAEEEESESVVE